MPELPEVQTVVNSLVKIKDKKIYNINIHWEKVVYNSNPQYVINKIKNTKVIKIERFGKYISIKLSKGYLVFHLRMTGYLYASEVIPKNCKYIRCYLTFNDNTFLIFEDMRKFGGFYYWNELNILKNKLGIDPTSNRFTKNWLFFNITKRNRMIKSILLDQSFICGLGNIYIDEILWKSKIHPTRLTSTLKKIETNSLCENIILTLKLSLKYHGTTIINFKFDNMKTGGYGKFLNVYGREGEKCKRCNHLISKLRIASRGTYICPKCQDI